LLSGVQGRLLANMLTAMGMSEDQVYFASALPRHTPMADTNAAAQAGLGAVLTRHIELVAPKRLLAFGLNVLPLFQHGVTKDETSLREINHSGSSQTILVSEGLDSLMTMPTLKARFWRRWMEWSAPN
jgi:DNA polymerase